LTHELEDTAMPDSSPSERIGWVI